jgi:hypothetical protein
MKRLSFILSVALLLNLDVTAQRSCGLWLNEVPLVADTVAGTIYATIDPGVNGTLKATLRWDNNLYNGIELNGIALVNGRRDNLEVQNWSMNASSTLAVKNAENKEWKLVFSTLPFVVIDCPLKEMDRTYSMTKGTEGHNKKFPGYISVIDARCRTKMKDSDAEGIACFSSEIRTRLRGATTGSQPKQSLNIELVKDGESQDVHLLGYRKDDDWILSAEYLDYSRMRNRVLMDLWTAVDVLPYPTDNKYQCNGTQGEFVEVFINGAYYGMYCFTDKIDRKKLNLKKTKEATETAPEVKRGLLWKANWECSETYLGSYDSLPANDSFLWPYKESKESYGWEQKYPDDTITQAFFTPICELMDFFDTKEFKTTYNDWLYEDNVIDFMLFIQAFQLVDNQKKNYYLSVRNIDKEEKFLFTLWDLDGSIGRMAGGSVASRDSKQMAWGEKLGYHHLIHMFKTKKERPDDFATKMNNRWQYLSTHELSLENIRALMEKYADQFVTSGAWERERARWVPTYKKGVVKITETPHEEVDSMIAFLEVNYAIFNEKMESDKWTPHDVYNEEEYLKGRTQTSDALYVIGKDVNSKHEDAIVTMQGSVDQELVDGISKISYNNDQMTIVREDGEKKYDITEIKEVKAKHTGIYPTPAFIPDSLKKYFEFDTHYAPVNEYKATKETSFVGQRTVQVFFEGDDVSVKGNLDGITCTIDTTTVSIATELEGVSILVSGCSDKGKIILDSKNPCKLAATEGGSMFSSIIANCDLVINSAYALNFYNEEFDGKCIYTTGDVTFEDGNYYFLLTCSGTLTDASFPKTAELGARAVLAKNITVNDGKISIKSIGHNGAVGLAATEDLTINGGKNYIATYDDPLKIGKHLTVNGGFTFTSSLTNDGTDSKSSIYVNDGFICSCGPEGSEAAFDVKNFTITGGTVIGLAHKCDKPKKAKETSQAFIILDFYTNLKRYVKIADADGGDVAMLETQAYPTQTIFYSSAALVKDGIYTILTGDTTDTLQELTTVTAITEK